MQSSFAWDLPRNLTIKCSLFCTKFIPKNLYLAENSLYKKPLFLERLVGGLKGEVIRSLALKLAMTFRMTEHYLMSPYVTS